MTPTHNLNPAIDSILVIGAAGMLGQELVRQLQNTNQLNHQHPPQVFAYDINQIDITQPDSVNRCIADIQPQVVINCAAVTDVDGCESQPEHAFAVNATGPKLLAVACRQRNCKLVHISTDFVFDGQSARPYLPEDPTNPISVYGRSKCQGEENIRANLDNHLIVRTSWLFGPQGKNFVATIAQAAKQKPTLQVVTDQVGCPTYTIDLAQALINLIAADTTGTTHFHNQGQCSWFQFAQEIVRQCKLKTEVQQITAAQLNRPAPRPAYSVLDITSYQTAAKHTPRTWTQALNHYLTTQGIITP
ncbi:MAG: dTDP-4-dehydrorhamnose reductase [Sedimentisphaerales bacterium]|nr:dTDP-4-dehydrorhamnose reductase [Sedimentisphaerales bacterium]